MKRSSPFLAVDVTNGGIHKIRFIIEHLETLLPAFAVSVYDVCVFALLYSSGCCLLCYIHPVVGLQSSDMPFLKQPSAATQAIRARVGQTQYRNQLNQEPAQNLRRRLLLWQMHQGPDKFQPNPTSTQC